MKFIKLISRKSKAQAIVEFAIALPVLLLLVYGLLETGRYLFLYSTVVNASRQAVRYGSATGIGNNNVPRYQDCQGIRSAAQTGAYVATFDTITIQWDDGPADATPTTYCTSGNTDTSLTSTILADNAHRIRVTIQEPYVPLLPKLVPFVARTITATSSRTVLLSVSIAVTAGSTLNPSTPTQPTATFTSTITPSITNTPSYTPTNTFTSTPTVFTPTKTYTPTATNTPTDTPTPTYTPTPSNTPTASSTPISNCNLVAHGAETISSSSKIFSMKIDNPTGVPLVIQDITVWWNHDGGHTGGADSSLRLQSVYINTPLSADDILVGQWSPAIYSTTYTIYTNGITLDPGQSIIIFNFHQTYQRKDGTERIYINLGTNGCQSYSIDSNTAATVP
jgi:Flp pilus assembly protein TadG